MAEILKLIFEKQSVDGIQLARDRDQCWALMNAVRGPCIDIIFRMTDMCLYTLRQYTNCLHMKVMTKDIFTAD
jgi:hypothetical protein